MSPAHPVRTQARRNHDSHPGHPGRRNPRIRRSLLALACTLAWPAAAQALSLAPATLHLDSALTAGEFHFLGVQSGLPAGAVVGYGSVAPGDVTLLFSFSVDADADGAALVAGISPAVGQPWTAAGHVPGGGSTPHSVIDSQPGFVGFGIGVLPGGSTSTLFVSAPSIALGAEYSVAFGYSTSTWAAGTVTVVPEPATAILMGVGVALLARPRCRNG